MESNDERKKEKKKNERFLKNSTLSVQYAFIWQAAVHVAGI